MGAQGKGKGKRKGKGKGKGKVCFGHWSSNADVAKWIVFFVVVIVICIIVGHFVPWLPSIILLTFRVVSGYCIPLPPSPARYVCEARKQIRCVQNRPIDILVLDPNMVRINSIKH